MKENQMIKIKDNLIKLVTDAGQEILNIYQNEEEFEVEAKSDRSPLTKADKRSNSILCEGISNLDEKYPIISEENKQVPYEKRKLYQRYWLIDPLDGTKEFIKRNGEFTVNVALIENGQPILGIVYAPCLDELYWSVRLQGSYVIHNGIETRLKVNSFDFNEEGIRVVCSRSHMNAETKQFIDTLNTPKLVSKGSSLKFLILAKAEAEVYPRIAPTMEWDTAAAHIILEEAGGSVLTYKDHKPLTYNKQQLLNPPFIATARIRSQ